jgi:cell division protein FtsL
MILRPGTIVWLVLVVGVGYAMFQVKYEVMRQENALASLNKQIAQNREQLRVLNAEWSYLTRPDRLERLAARYLNLGPIRAAQIVAPTDVPERPNATGPLAAPATASVDPSAASRPATAVDASIPR